MAHPTLDTSVKFKLLVSGLMAWLEERRFTSTSAETAERERGAA